ncbi:hypothetical protein SOPP22_17450 [Shewanella sp. OPT22]|nr:hypothetical protein SOPP22_17450 [Shewanella sp. OPT22]
MRASVLAVVLLVFSSFSWAQAQIAFDLSKHKSHWSFYDVGFPNDINRQGSNVSFDDFPMQLNPIVREYVKSADKADFGFTPDMPIYLHLLGDVESNSLQLPIDANDSLKSDSSVQLINIDSNSPDFGLHSPIKVEITTEKDAYRPKNLLQILPAGKFLSSNTKYALIITTDINTNDEVSHNQLLQDVLSGKISKVELTTLDKDKAAKAIHSYRALAEYLKDKSIGLDTILGATVWTTGDPASKMRSLAKQVSELSSPKPNGNLSFVKNTDNVCILKGTWNVPEFQSGLFPYVLALNGGTIKFDRDGKPVIDHYRQTPFYITLPKSEMPESGYPIVFYDHGTGGEAAQVFKRGYTNKEGKLTREGNVAQIAGLADWATASMGGHMGADDQASRPIINKVLKHFSGLTLNLATYNILNPRAMRDNLNQMMMEQILFHRMVSQLTIPSNICGKNDASKYANNVFFDSDKQVAQGQSLGSFISGMEVAADPKPFSAYIPSGVGSVGLTTAMGYAATSGQKELGEKLAPMFFWTKSSAVTNNPFHPLYALSSSVMSSADFVYGLADKRQQPEKYGALPSTLSFNGFYDDNVQMDAQKKYLRALRPDLGGQDISGLSESNRYSPTINHYGGSITSLPVEANMSDGETNIEIRLPEDKNKSGHYVFFQYSELKHQAQCFLDDIAKGKEPRVRALGGKLGEHCD